MVQKFKYQKLFAHLILLAGGCLMLFPFFWLLTSAFKPEADIFRMPIEWIPRVITFENFANGWNGLPGYTFAIFFRNSFFVTTTVVLASVLSSSFVAYGFSRIDFQFKNAWFLALLSTLMIPSQVTLIPLYIIFANLGVVNTYVPLTIDSFFGGGAFFIFLLRQFYDSIPKELDESARMDGCGHFQIYWRIILPLAKPALFSVVVFSFIWTYNEFLAPLIYLNDVNKFTLPVALRMFIDSTGSSNWGGLLSMTVLTIIPPMILFAFAQRYFIEGISTSGMKN